MTDPTSPPADPTWKRLLLVMVTALVTLVLLQSLINSWNQPQVASQLELYQTDLLLQSSAWKFNLGEPPGGSGEDWQRLRQGLLGKDPVATAQQQYEKVQERASTNLSSLSSQETILREAGQPLGRQQQSAAAQQRRLIDQIDLRLRKRRKAEAEIIIKAPPPSKVGSNLVKLLILLPLLYLSYTYLIKR